MWKFIVLMVSGLAAFVANPQTGVPVRVSKMPTIHSFWETELERRSETKDEAKHFIPPWTAASVTLDFLQRPTSQRAVTVVPLDTSLPSLQLRVEQVDIWNGGCGEQHSVSWTATIPVASAAYLNAPTTPGHLAQSPFELLVIYPAVPLARALAVGDVPATELPKGVPRSIISAAVDVTGSGKPDLLVATYCCEGGGKAPMNGNCDLSCQDYYQKRNGRWFIVRRVRPC